MNLVIQGIDVQTGDLKTLAKLVSASRIERITGCAFRLCDASPNPEIEPYCAQAQLDHAFVPRGRLLADYRLAVMDMDSTLITIECIDEIADMQGIKAQVAAITEAAMRGEIDYAESLRQRVRLLAGMEVSAFERVYRERLRLTAGAEPMLHALRAAGIRTLLVSGGFTFFTARLKQRLALDRACSNEPEVVAGRLTGRLVGDIVDGEGKAKALREMRDALGVSRDQIIGIGDGANDLPFLAECGVSIAYHAKPAVRAAATDRLDYIDLAGVIALFE